MNKPLQLVFGCRLCCFTVYSFTVQVKVCSQYLNLKCTYSVTCFASKTVFKALHRGERMQCADKTRFLPLHPVYRIMHSIPGSGAARLSNLMSSCSKWNVSGSCQDESFCLLAPRFDQMAAKILVMYVEVLGPATHSVNKAIKTDADTLSNQFAIWTWCSPPHTLVVFRGWVSRGERSVCEKSFQPGGVGVFVGGERYKLLSESWYQLNPFTIYIFTSTSLLAAQ